jgi:predicted peroxiredoxin
MTIRGAAASVVAAIVLSAVAACGRPQLAVEPVAAEPPRDGVFIHISHGPEDPHRVLMALQMAQMMAQDREVLVYLDIHGIEVVLADAEDLSFGHFPSSRTQIAALLAAGVPVFACPGCLKAAGRTAEDLAPGVQVADKEAFFDFTDGRILTLDY